MKCEHANSLIVDWLNNELAEKDRIAFETHLANCAACQQAGDEAQVIFGAMHAIDIPAPSVHMEARFSDTLRSYKQQHVKPKFWGVAREKIQGMVRLTPGFRVAYSLILLLAGGLVSYLIFPRPADASTQQELTALSGKVEDMRQTIILSLLDNSSPGKRMRAASYAEEATTIDQQVIDALFITLNEDPNINVRLATLDALAKYGKDPKVRQGLVQSIVLQESPLLQAALADIMLKLQEKKAVDPFKSLLKKQRVSDPVRKKIQTIIQTLAI